MHVNLSPLHDGNFVQIRMRMDVNKPFTVFLTIMKEKKKNVLLGVL